MNQELFSYGTYEIGTLTKFKDTVMNLTNRTTVVGRELLNRTLHYDQRQAQNCKYSVNYAGQAMLYLMTISEQHLSVYEVFIYKLKQSIDALDILSIGHLPIALLSPTQLTNMLG